MLKKIHFTLIKINKYKQNIFFKTIIIWKYTDMFIKINCLETVNVPKVSKALWVESYKNK